MGVKEKTGKKKKWWRVQAGRQKKALFYFNGAVSWATRAETTSLRFVRNYVRHSDSPRFDMTTPWIPSHPLFMRFFLSFLAALALLFPYAVANLTGVGFEITLVAQIIAPFITEIRGES